MDIIHANEYNSIIVRQYGKTCSSFGQRTETEVSLITGDSDVHREGSVADKPSANCEDDTVSMALEWRLYH